jgi:hypothetical protein
VVFSDPQRKIRASRPDIKLRHDHFHPHHFFLRSWPSNMDPLVLMMGWDGRRIRNQELWAACPVISSSRGWPERQ